MSEALPIEAQLPELLSAIQGAGNVVLRAPTGAGKTTRVPLALLKQQPSNGGRILLLQPRRLAARAAAQRMAQQSNTDLGALVGYHVRFDKKYSKSSKIIVMTDGLYLQHLLHNPFLDGVSAILFDEFHERSAHSELALSLTKQLQKEVREDLQILVMSATLDCEPISAYLNQCPIVVTTGRTHPVAISYLPHTSSLPVAERTAKGVLEVLPSAPHNILVFLPGAGEIQATKRILSTKSACTGWKIHPLYGALSLKEQRQAIAPSSQQTIILATNIAETSLTIPGIRTVVDSGLARVNRLNPETGLNRLELEPICKASATQRAGRAGRTAPGTCLRLWSEREDRARSDELEPELERIDLSESLLTLLHWGEPDIHAFDWLSPPQESRLEGALRLLEQLGALDEGGITKLGRRLAELPVHPRLGRTLIEATKLGAGRRGAVATALLSERDPFPSGHRFPQWTHCDLAGRIDGVLARDPACHPRGLQQLERVTAQLARLVPGSEFASDTDEALGKALLTAFPDRVARRREPESPRGVMVGGRGVRLGPRSGVSQGEFFLCLRLRAGKAGPRAEALVDWASTIPESWLETTKRVALHFDTSAEQVRAIRQRCYRDLVLEQQPAPLPSGPQVGRLLAEHARKDFERLFRPTNEAEQLLFRLRWLREIRPDQDLPRVDSAHIQDLLDEVCRNKRSFAELRSHNWRSTFIELLTWEQRRALDELAPERLTVPSGSALRLEYTKQGPPILKVRIQELFGATKTPAVGGGRVPVLLHLLAPNQRAQQITSDLPGFWKTTYAEVRRELRQRYPKHAWPEDPQTAKPEKRPRRKRK
jgi:ATP-dependent helicase HrpB